ncbi:MAG: flagellar motor switch protein FliN, partial [Gammaproteobacteria bacterium]|nr:flagellar motor switch protein FliN [Gammaproteobacteria bacterium]
MNDETDDPVDQQAMADEWAAAMEEQTDAAGGMADEVEKVEATSLQESQSYVQGDVNLDVVLDIPVTIAMEIGRTKISIRNLLQLNQGSVVELDRLAGEPMDVLVNGTLVAHG